MLKKLNIKPRFNAPIRLRMVAMIDVVFLLLVFFLLSANFRPPEGFLPSQLPRAITRSEIIELEPLTVIVRTAPDNTCYVELANQISITITPGNRTAGFTELTSQLHTLLQSQGRNTDDPIQLIYLPQTRWLDTLKTHDTLRSMKIKNIILSMGS